MDRRSIPVREHLDALRNASRALKVPKVMDGCVANIRVIAEGQRGNFGGARLRLQ